MIRRYLPAVLGGVGDDWLLSLRATLGPRGGVSALFAFPKRKDQPLRESYTRMLKQYGPVLGSHTLPKDSYLFGDSGGYTIMTQGLAIDPRDVIRWQLRDYDAGVILDVPPYADNAGGNTVGFREALDRTKRNLELALPLYREAREQGTDFRWWGVLHGRSTAEMRTWWSELAQVYPFDDTGEGWAFKASSTNDPRALARTLRFLGKVGVRRAHSLMTGGVPGTAALKVFGARAGLEFLTHDASSPWLAGIRGEVLVPNESLDGWAVLADRVGGEARRHLLEACECLSCEAFRSAGGGASAAPGLWRYRYTHHNLLATLRVFETLDLRIAADEKIALQAYLGRSYLPALRAFDGAEPHQVELGTPRSLLDYT